MDWPLILTGDGLNNICFSLKNCGFWNPPPTWNFHPSVPNPQNCFTKTSACCSKNLSEKKNLNLVYFSVFYALWKLHLNCYMTVFREAGSVVADDIYLGTKHNSAWHSLTPSVSFLYLLNKMENKANRSSIVWD